MKPATSPIWSEAIRNLEKKSEDQRTEFERHTHDRLVELESLIANGNEAMGAMKEQLALVQENITKACGAYENLSDMLATYYMKAAKEKMQGEKDEETDEADNADGQQPDSDTDEATPQASS